MVVILLFVLQLLKAFFGLGRPVLVGLQITSCGLLVQNEVALSDELLDDQEVLGSIRERVELALAVLVVE